MNRSSLLRALCVTAALLLISALAACDAVESPASEAGLASAARPSADVAQSDLLKAVRRATARFNSTTQALKAGYVPTEHCAAHAELGAMGYHWANQDLIDPVFDPLKPEVLLYAPGEGGNLRLAAIEYIVIDVGQPHPMFGDHPFDVGGTPIPVDHYSLHVWLYEDNPSGIFSPFNPNVSCPAH
jgi:hypothetical protein